MARKKGWTADNFYDSRINQIEENSLENVLYLST
jgi:hypothetical protein